MLEKREAIKIFNKLDPEKKPIPFSIEFVKANRIKNTGGQKVYIKNAVLLKYVKNTSYLKANKRAYKGMKNYQKMRVINIFDLDKRKVYKIHLPLILRVNDVEFYF